MPIPPPPPPPPGPPPPPTLSQVGVTLLGGEVACPHVGPLARGIAPGEGWLWQGWGAPGGGNVELGCACAGGSQGGAELLLLSRRTRSRRS